MGGLIVAGSRLVLVPSEAGHRSDPLVAALRPSLCAFNTIFLSNYYTI